MVNFQKQIGRNGKRKMYNTSTADLIAKASGGVGEKRWKEYLYKSPRGDYFLVGSGGKLTRWCGKTDLVSISGSALNFWIKTKVKKNVKRK